MTKPGAAVGITRDRPVELIDVAALVPYERNARTHSEDQVKQIVASIREWGWTNPMLVDEKGVILAGHGRRLAALEIGLKKVPCIVARGWTAAQRRAYVLADNRLAEQAGWDKGMLRFELDALMGAGFNLDLTGFSAVDVRGLLAGAEGNTDPDDVPETPKHPVSRPGDIWILGEHRIACERTGRKAYAIELNPAYVDVAVARWQAFTGKAATREADGVTFDALLPEAA